MIVLRYKKTVKVLTPLIHQLRSSKLTENKLKRVKQPYSAIVFIEFIKHFLFKMLLALRKSNKKFFLKKWIRKTQC